MFLSYITETWLKVHIDDNILSILSYNIIRPDRKGIDHGGICIYVQDSVCFKVLHDFMNDEFEVLWMQIWPERLTRGVQSIIAEAVYHPPSACDPSMRNYLYESMSRIEAQFSDCGLFLLGDFNKLGLSCTTNVDRCKKGRSLPPFGLSEHAKIKFKPLNREKLPSQKIILQSRDLRATKRLTMRIYLEEVYVCSLVGSLETFEKKTDTLETLIKTGMDNLLPLTPKTVMTNDTPWINKQLKCLIHQRQVAFAQGDLFSFSSLRNRVDRLRKSCRGKYYASKVEHLRNCKLHTLWKDVKTLVGMKAATRTDPMSVLRHVDPGPNSGPTALADAVNEAFLEPMNIFTPLAHDATSDVRYPNPTLVSEFFVLKKLSALNPAKSSGPDMIPSWLLNENEDFLDPLVTYISCSFAEARLPQSWKYAYIVPIPKQVPVYDVNRHLRPISLTPALSKVAEEFVVEQHVKPAVPAKVDPKQFGTIPGSNTTEALFSVMHAWNSATDGNRATVRAVLFDFKRGIRSY